MHLASLARSLLLPPALLLRSSSSSLPPRFPSPSRLMSTLPGSTSEPLQPREAHILIVGDPKDPNNPSAWPAGATVAATIQDPADIASIPTASLSKINVLFCSSFLGSSASSTVATLLPSLPALQWLHQRSAGVEHTLSPTLAAHPCAMTNARGVFSSSLAEYCLMACAYFAKDVPRLMRQKEAKNWEK